MSSPPNITTITPPRVPLVDPQTGIIAREWYRFFLNLFTLTYANTGGGTDELALAPLPTDYTGLIDSGLESLEVAPPPVDYSTDINALKNGAAIGTAPPVIFGTLAYQNSESAFVTRLSTVSATTGVRNGSIYEDSAFLVATGTNGVVTAVGATSVTVTQSTGFRPFASNIYNLGTSSQRWASVYANEYLAGAAQEARFKENAGFAVVDGDNGVTTGIGGTVVTVTQSSGFRPNFSYTYNLGTSSQRWYSVYAQEFLAGDTQQARFKESSAFALVDGDNGVITAYAGTGVTVTQSSGFRPTFSYTYNLGTSSQRWYSVYAQEFLAGDTQQAQYKESSSTAFVTGNAGVQLAYSGTSIAYVDSSSLRPNVSSSYNLGTSSYFWSGAYANTFYAENTTTKFYEDSGFAVIVGSSGVVTGYGTTGVTVTQTTGFRPQLDNTYNLGTSGQRWGTVYAATGTINTSDATEKQQVRDLSDAERRVAIRIKSLVRAFKWNSAVALKGDAARTHVGVMAQDVRDAFAVEGLDAHDYGMFCSDKIECADGTTATRLGVRYDQLLTFALAAL